MTPRTVSCLVLGLLLLSPPHLRAQHASPASSGVNLEVVSNGFRTLLPHRIHALDGAGNPTAQVIEIRSLDDLVENATPTNPVLPNAPWPTSPTLPGGIAGNHFLVVRFDAVLDVDSILDPSPSAAGHFQLTGALSVIAVDPATGAAWPVPGRAFVGGLTYAGQPSGSPPEFPLQRWVSASGGGVVADSAVDNDLNGVPDGLGFPGTQPGPTFPGEVDLVAPDTFVFVADGDANLLTHETFPSGVQIVVAATEAVRSRDGRGLVWTARVAGTVGQDLLPPELELTPPPVSAPRIVPGNGDVDVDPLTTVTLFFTESVQPSDFGALTGAGAASLSPAVSLVFGPPTMEVQVPYTALPTSPYDLGTIVLTPGFPFPGSGPSGSCGGFDRVDVTVNPGQTRDLAGSTNLLSASTHFVTGEGPGVTNAPVAPDTIYAGIEGASIGLSVIDLNGFGASTGNPTWDQNNPVVEGNSNYPNNPNVLLQGSLLRPPLAPGACTVDGGSAGVFTRTLDSSLEPVLARAPYLLSVQDLALGQALDTTFNNGPAPFGCQAGGGSLCSTSGLQRMQVIQAGPNSVGPPVLSNPILNDVTGGGNTISFAPHPNPPPLVFPPLCVSPHIGGDEPTSVETSLWPPGGLGLSNLLVPGDPFGNPAWGIPPDGLLTVEQNLWFEGPSPPKPLITQCQQYMVRQQVGHFLYVVDRERCELVVLNSNRMTPIDRIALPDPIELAVGPNLDLLAVTNLQASSVSFVDIDPTSATFHQVVMETVVGRAPRGIAWDSLNEDVLVCNEGGGTVSVISATSLAVRKTLTSHLARPFAVAITPRQAGFGWERDVYYGYVLNRDGSLAIFESGPDGPNGWGYDDIIGTFRETFHAPKTMQVDPSDLRSGVWIVHERKIDLAGGGYGPPGTGAVSKVYLQSSVTGKLPLQGGTPPQFRQMTPVVEASLGEEVLTGVPVDLAFDDQRNFGALVNVTTVFSAGVPAAVNGKSLVRDLPGSTSNFHGVSAPRFLFLAVPDSAPTANGAVDVIELSGLTRFDTSAFHPGVQSIPAPGVSRLMNYFRQ